jgi:ROS/MUCR transcriptional regulator protein
VSAEMISEVAAGAAAGPDAGLRAARLIRSVAGVLADGTVHYAPVGEVALDGVRIICHLCGRSYRSVAAHLASHGWTKDRYCEAFGLERSQSLESSETRKLRAAALTARLVFDPAIVQGSAAGRERAKAGELARDAAAAAKGRAFPEQRRRKAARARPASPSAVVAQANRDRADRHLAEVAESVARAHGFADLQAYVADRTQAGVSLAAISRAAGLHKDWLSRHLRRIDPEAAATVTGAGHPGRAEARWLPVLRSLGFCDLAGYLRCRHAEQHWTVNAMSAELGVSRHALEAAMARHGLTRVAHAAKRHAAEQRAADVAVRLGYASIAEYVARRRSDGLTWRALAAESGQPQTWLRRHAGPSLGG